MSSLYSASNITLNQMEARNIFECYSWLNNVSLILNSPLTGRRQQIILFIMLFTLRAK